ncbi:MAG: NRDE family protein [Verrucomicrobiae bacterium]|nr:NRDE family protein [Verrucomicrobiae bacterium]MCP5539760.1 NRDE family protein [Akkermansiaceae bacterium]MCP5551872.1 NRDE family protein [Akkermansiaceae bacterium]
MCTLTWWRGAAGEGYEVFFNRDELKTRPPAKPPAAGERGGVRFLSPVDTQAGGTWIWANQFGVVMALLNWYDRESGGHSRERTTSRGVLLRDLAGSRGLAEAGAALRARGDLGTVKPFTLAGFEPGGDIQVWRWDGIGELEDAAAPPMPVTSSSFETERVLRARGEAFLSLGAAPTPEKLEAYHRNAALSGQPAAPSAFTVRMNRPDAQTWSRSRIRVEEKRVVFDYLAEAPDLAGEPQPFRAELSR